MQKKADLKFKTAGAGHRLSEPRAVPQSVAKGAGTNRSTRPRDGPAEEAKKAAEAAIARLEAPLPGYAKGGSTAIQIRMRKELEAERKAAKKKLQAEQASTASTSNVVEADGPHQLSVSGVYYNCALIGPDVLPYNEMELRIEGFLYAQAEEEPALGYALIIQTLNKSPEKIKVCVETLCKYLDNIIQNPDEEKFRKIRLGNKAFQDRVKPITGAVEFLQAVGYKHEMQCVQDQEEEFLVISAERAQETGVFIEMKEVLVAAEPIRPQLDRSLRVLAPSGNVTRFDLPDEFFNVTVDEVKKEQQQRTDSMEKQLQLRTKAMKEREEQRELRKYRFTLIRIRFPDNIILQGTFRSTETVGAVYECIRENLVNSWQPFYLVTGDGSAKLEEECPQTLAELKLAPAALIIFAWEPEVLKEISSQLGTTDKVEYLTPSLLARMETLQI